MPRTRCSCTSAICKITNQQINNQQFRRTAAITFGPAAEPLDVDEHIHVPCDVPASPLRLWEHLAIKLILNTLSTATMVRMGRVIGNAMVWVSPSNKKLIDRGCRLIVHQTGCTYEHACEVLHEAIEEVAERAQTRRRSAVAGGGGDRADRVRRRGEGTYDASTKSEIEIRNKHK